MSKSNLLNDLNCNGTYRLMVRSAQMKYYKVAEVISAK
mgnify:CR=1 FL=1